MHLYRRVQYILRDAAPIETREEEGLIHEENMTTVTHNTWPLAVAVLVAMLDTSSSQTVFSPVTAPPGVMSVKSAKAHIVAQTTSSPLAASLTGRKQFTSV